MIRHRLYKVFTGAYRTDHAEYDFYLYLQQLKTGSDLALLVPEMRARYRALGLAALSLLIMMTTGCDPKSATVPPNGSESLPGTQAPIIYNGPSPAWREMFTADADLLTRVSTIETAIPNIDLCDHRLRLVDSRDTESYAHVFPSASEHHRADEDSRDEFTFQLRGLSMAFLDRFPGLENAQGLRLLIYYRIISNGARPIEVTLHAENGSPVQLPSNLVLEFHERCP